MWRQNSKIAESYHMIDHQQEPITWAPATNPHSASFARLMYLLNPLRKCHCE